VYPFTDKKLGRSMFFFGEHSLLQPLLERFEKTAHLQST
jgi:hypothetical protein